MVWGFLVFLLDVLLCVEEVWSIEVLNLWSFFLFVLLDIRDGIVVSVMNDVGIMYCGIFFVMVDFIFFKVFVSWFDGFVVVSLVVGWEIFSLVRNVMSVGEFFFGFIILVVIFILVGR